jgi:methionyl-tRNA formyltransferase
MRIVFFGSPASALPSLRKILEVGHSVKLIITQPDKPSGRGKKVTPCPVRQEALQLNIPTCQPVKIKQDLITLEKIKEIQPELIVVAAYGQIIPASIIYLPRYHSVNVHFSLLPKYRGASPVQWALLNGEEKTGITIFELNEKMDEGEILSQKEVEILPDENAAELEARLAQKGAELLVETIARLDSLEHLPQDHSRATYAPKLNKEDGRIDWRKSAIQIERQVRAFTPWPSAYAFLDEKRIIILKGKRMEDKFSSSSSPGEIIELKKEGIEVCCGQRTIYLVQSLQAEGRRKMDAFTFCLGAKIRVGDKLASQ